MPGAGLEPARPNKGTPDFKSGAYHQFRHPGGLRIAAVCASFARRELEARRDLGRGFADNERDFLVGLEDEVRRISGLQLAVDVPPHPLVATHLDGVEEDGPFPEELAECELVV